MERCLVKDPESPYAPHLKRVVAATLADGLVDRLRKEVLRQLDKDTDSEAIGSYRKALRAALLAPVAHGLNIVGLETGRRGGWRAALIDGRGELIDYAVVRPGERGSSKRRAASAGKPAAASGAGAAVGSVRADAAMSPPPLPGGVPAAGGAPPPTPAASDSSGGQAEGTAGTAEPDDPAAGAKAPEKDNPRGPKRSARRMREARQAELSEILAANDVDLIVYPAGPRQRTTERFVRAQIRRSGKADVAWAATRDSGTWIYATSKVAKRELPHLEPAVRSAVSLARRVQDPMAELVKLGTRIVGIGVHHHEVDPGRLRDAMGRSVERAVHDAGVDVNIAPFALLARVPGLTERLARRIVQHRRKKGPFRARKDLLKVNGLSESVYAQAVGFLRVFGGDPMDGTGAHPEYRELYEGFAEAAGCDVPTLLAEPERLDAIDPEQFATAERPVVQVRSAMAELQPKRRQLRATFEVPRLAVPLRPEEDLRPGSKVTGVVASLADFGAFIDVGGDQDGLLHVSQIRREHLRDSKPDLKVGEPVEVFIKASDRASGRIGLSMWPPRSRSGRNGARPGRSRNSWDRPRGRGNRRFDRGDRRRPLRRTFGPDTDRKAKRGRSKLSMEKKLEMLQDRYRTKV